VTTPFLFTTCLTYNRALAIVTRRLAANKAVVNDVLKKIISDDLEERSKGVWAMKVLVEPLTDLMPVENHKGK
jgi:hypothetical protein